MGITYETDGIDGKSSVELSVRSALVVKSVANLIGCKSWLVARLALRELRTTVDALSKAIEAGSKT